MRHSRLVIGGAPPAFLEAVLGYPRAGIKRALMHSPVGVLPRASYLHLIELLRQPATAKSIYHLNSLQSEYIDALHSVPGPLRRIVAPQSGISASNRSFGGRPSLSGRARCGVELRRTGR